MTSHIRQPGMADSLEEVLKAELSCSTSEVLERTDWPNKEIVKCNDALSHEAARVIDYSSSAHDSVKGETTMELVYLYTGSATDAITLCVTGPLALTECKYGIKLGGTGPFSSSNAFKRDVAKKFDKVEKKLIQDQEAVRRLRLLVVSHDQLPYTIAHIKALEQLELPAGSFSTDGKQHLYAVCSTTEARTLTNTFSLASLEPGSTYIFTL